MKPQTVLKIDPVGKSKGDIYRVRDEWIKEYEKYIENNHECEELGAVLIDRVKRAAEMLIKRYVGVPDANDSRKDTDSDFDWDDYNPEYKEENASLDGDFPLGNGHDADFATPYFTIENLVRIQFGETNSVPTGHYVEPAYDVLVRKGFIHELNKEWAEAESCYRGGGMSKSVLKREFECRRKKEAEGELAYGAAQHHMESGEWSKVYPFLQKAVDMENSDAMVDMGLARIYGTFGVSTDYAEGLDLLRKATYQNNIRACMELVELHDNGAADIEGDEAERLCKKAAEAGEKKAIIRLEDGFDTRPLIEILKEQAEKGNADAMWWLYNSAVKRKCHEEAQVWHDKALEAGQTDALLFEAEKCLNKNSYNPRLAEHYLRRAADKGNIRAIIALGKLELNDGDDDFWTAAMKKESADFEVCSELAECHKKQFAWIKLAADACDDESMYHMAIAYRFGYPIQKDESEAFRWAKDASEQGNSSAMYLTGYCLENGFGVEKDIEGAVKYYAESAERGIVPSMLRLYEIYRDGLENIPADKEKANRYLWLSGIGRS